eukprot:5875130-Prymnesium_polylepis.1
MIRVDDNPCVTTAIQTGQAGNPEAHEAHKAQEASGLPDIQERNNACSRRVPPDERANLNAFAPLYRSAGGEGATEVFGSA